MQCPALDLGPLASDQWKEVWWAQLHNHKGVTQAWWEQGHEQTQLPSHLSASALPYLFLTIGIQGEQVGSVQHLHRQPLLSYLVVAADAQASKPVLFQRPL